MQFETSTLYNATSAVTQISTSTQVPCQLVQLPKWDPEAIYQLIFGFVMIFLAIPGFAVGFYFLRRRIIVGANGNTSMRE